jgi:prophage regulatory protein
MRHAGGSLRELQESIAADAIEVEKCMKDKQLGNTDHSGSFPYLLRLPAVLRITGLGRSTLYRLISEGAFPPPVKLARRASAWRQEEVQWWASARAPAAHRPGPESLSNGRRQGPF